MHVPALHPLAEVFRSTELSLFLPVINIAGIHSWAVHMRFVVDVVAKGKIAPMLN
jgi:hypothetical protein